MVLSKRTQYLDTFEPRQYWSIPYFVICYISKNPSSATVYRKLVQSCKHFFIKNPNIVVGDLYCVRDALWWAYLKKEKKEVKKAEVEKLTSQFWITRRLAKDYFTLNGRSVLNNISYVFPKIYRIDNVKDIFFKHQKILLNNFLLLSPNLVKFNFWYSTVENENGSIVPVEDIVAVLPKVKDFNFVDSLHDEDDPAPPSFTTNTVKKLLKIPHFSKIDVFELHFVPETFDIETFFVYIKKNKHTKFLLQCAPSVSEAYYRRFKEVNAEIAANKNYDYKVPDIY